ncbi:(deoxy)nucleoside triphosphate pyrophosphohydrolase [Planctomicrobium sp. SH668]|uniref:(deoxy)nucleoside triphosphate pyrophosphohydrolase n=1 Tax=Planctomicrobium sp. SH668 TaxID=3448126 RepID=UPI003F5B8F5A
MSLSSPNNPNDLPNDVKRIGIAIVCHECRFLAGIRESGTVLAGMHEFPGGKCEANESPAECARRECLEETGLHVEPSALLDHTSHTYDHGSVELYFYLCQPIGLRSDELHQRFFWHEIDRIRELNFPAANAAAIEKLLSYASQADRST